jgi:hypothetical protein
MIASQMNRLVRALRMADRERDTSQDGMSMSG